MRRNTTLLALIPCAALALARGQEAPASIDWRSDLVAARAEARDTGKPLFLVFRCEQ